MDAIDSLEDISNNNNIGTPMDFKKTEGGVLSFYNGASVFLTGSTGFVGKALLEKLLRTCENLDTVFILMRPKRDVGVEHRFKELMRNMIFDTIRNKRPEQLEKVKPVAGDVVLPRLGLSQQDEDIMIQKVSIVIHSAATVRFVEPLSDALLLNTQGTRNVLEICSKFRNLKSIVHVSTAYSNANRYEVKEKVYPSASDADTLLQCANALPKESIDMIASSLTDGHPNTYTLTKSFAENIIQRHFGKLPIAIVRPSIVTAAYNEPHPGWVDNIFGVTGIAMEIYRGTLRTGYVDQNRIVDLIPVDFVVNMCIAAAWHHTTLETNDVTVYNCTSSQINPLLWDDFIDMVITVGRQHPSKHCMLYPNFRFVHSRLMNTFWEMLTHILPSYIFDMMLRAQGKKPIMLKISRRFKMAMVTGEFFACHEWNFQNDNFKSMLNALKETGENVYFPADLSAIDWKKYVLSYIMGVRKFVMKDSMDSMPVAKKNLQRLHIFHKFLHCATGYYFFNLLFGNR